MTQNFFFFFSLLCTLPSKVQAESLLAALSRGDIMGILGDFFSSNENILFFSFGVVMVCGCLLPLKVSKEDL